MCTKQCDMELSLNLDVPATGPGQEVSRKPKIFGDRKQRVQQRKKLKHERELSKGQGGTDHANQSTSRLPQKRKSESSEPREGAKQAKGDGVISSLFRKNPEIPEVESEDVTTNTENVFTGRTFGDLPIHPYLVSALTDKLGFTEMTEVQKRAIPTLLQHRDALVKSQTGSGKTLAYAVPIIQSLQARKLRIKREDGPYALVIVPTRELALQSFETFVKLLRTYIWIVPGCLMGGERRKAEKSRLRKGVNIVVATPGRLMDHIQTTSVMSLRRVQWLVIDEADRLLELGYERDIAQIINALKDQCPDPPQTVMLSATLSQGVNRLSSISLKDPELIDVSSTSDSSPLQTSSAPNSAPFTEKTGSDGTPLADSSDTATFTMPQHLKQYFIITPCKLRLVTLAAFLLWKCQYESPVHKMVVFLSTQDSVEFHYRLYTRVLLWSRQGSVAERLQAVADGESEGEEEEEEDESGGKKGLKLFRLYGDMEQKDRTKTFDEFSQAKSGVLLCTDVAARGLDLPNVDWIVQYTSPGSTVDYIHRVGRTARAGTKGRSLLFLMPGEASYVKELNRHKIRISQLQASNVFQNLLTHVDDLPPVEEESSRQHPRTQEEAATYLQDRFEACVLKNSYIHGLAGKGFQSFVRAYATYSKEVKAFFKVGDLHLGHVAKSFALREAPTRVHGVAAHSLSGKQRRKKEAEKSKNKRPLSFKQATLSEYSSGLEGIKTMATSKSGKTRGHGAKKKFKHKKC